MTRGSRERTGDVSILSKESEGEALPYFYRAVQEEDDSLGHSWKGLWLLSARGEDVPILQFN